MCLCFTLCPPHLLSLTSIKSTAGMYVKQSASTSQMCSVPSMETCPSMRTSSQTLLLMGYIQTQLLHTLHSYILNQRKVIHISDCAGKFHASLLRMILYLLFPDKWWPLYCDTQRRYHDEWHSIICNQDSQTACCLYELESPFQHFLNWRSDHAQV